MPTYSHGGDVWAYGPGLLDFSANLHPLGMPPAVAQAARDAVAQAEIYPDPLCRKLRQAIALRDGVEPDQVICGGGAADLIFRLCLAVRPKTALLTAPAFSEYRQALDLVGCATRLCPLDPEKNFDVDLSLLDHIRPDVDLLFLCTPNNPTGRVIDPAVLEAVIARCGETGTRLVLDECFLPLTEGRPMTAALAASPHLFLLRAFTKVYAMAGLRLGYGLSADSAFLDRLYAAGQPWAVSSVAQAAGIAACGCTDWPEKGRAVLHAERPRLKAGLEALGLRVWPGQANYLLFCAPGVTDLKERLLEKNLLIRSCANYRGLGGDYYRICVKTGPENDQLLRRMKEALHG